jgi:hypothetical protein
MWYSSDVKPVEGTNYVLVCNPYGAKQFKYMVITNDNFIHYIHSNRLWSYIQEPIITKNETK